ncbi:hypothetical protein CTAYLR_009629 [Chrysophaeum taylorii]|uniref:Protein kinase domain-containing protein n=1 Tax=Chrysophaeum taylorii TaxID=2483200 RepID=A0AAD7XN02_9STRA|nr:hypothetical protein CTAYLR_009629 [Chrysophaeum taylorii]
MMSLLSWSWRTEEDEQQQQQQQQHVVPPYSEDDMDVMEVEKRGHRRNRSHGQLEKNKKTRCFSCGGQDAESPRGSELVAVSQLGHGSFGRVYLVTSKKKKRTEDKSSLAALKAIPLASLNTKKKIEHVAYERRVVEALKDHPNVIELRGAWRCPNALYLLTEVAWGGELFRHLQHKRRFEPKQVCFLAAEIASALEHAHARRIAYRDLKPENVLLDAVGHVKLVDFGLSKIFEGPNDDATRGCRSLCGTPEYMAPETLNRQEYGYAVDFWALGMLSAELLSGLPPWYTSDRDELFRRIRFDPLELSPVVQAVLKSKSDDATWRWEVAREATDFVARLLDRNPHRRLGTSAPCNTHDLFKRFGYAGLQAARLHKLSPPYNPNAIAHLQQRRADDAPPKGNVASALWTHFGRAPLVSIAVDDISRDLAKVPGADDTKKVGDLPERSRAIRSWTYLQAAPPKPPPSQGQKPPLSKPPRPDHH